MSDRLRTSDRLPMSEKTAPLTKRRYSSPSLVTYRDVLLLTQNRLIGKNKDGGKGFKGRTR